MKKFKHLILLCIFILSQNLLSQSTNYTGHVTLLRKNGAMIYFGGGTTAPNTDSKKLGFGNPFEINLGFYKSIWQNDKTAFGIHAFGAYSFGTGKIDSTNYSVLPISGFTSTLENSTTPKYSGFSLGAGPQINFGIGENIMISPIVDFAYTSQTLDAFSVNQNYNSGGAVKSFSLYSQPEIKTSGLGIIPRLRFHYFLGKKIGIWLEGNYASLPKITTTTSTFVPNGTTNQGGTYNIDQLLSGTTNTQEVSINNSGIGFGGGIVIGLGSNKTDPPLSTPTASGGTIPRPKVVQNKDNESPSSNGEIFTSTPIKKGNVEKQNCIKIVSPSNGSNQSMNGNLKILLSNEGLKQSNTDIKIYKISNDKNFWNKPENLKQLLDNNNTVFLSGRYEKESATTGFNPISVDAKQSGAALESTLDKGKLTEGAYKMVVISNCGVTTSNFSVSNSNCNHSATIKSIDCLGNIDSNGNSKYRVCVDYKNTATSGCTNCLILLNNPSNHSGTVLQSANAGTIISNISSIPSNLSAGNTTTICFDATVTSGSNLQFFVLGTCQDGLQSSTNPNFENSYFNEAVKPCICDFATKY